MVRHQGGRRGKVTILVALSLSMIMGAGALTLDGGLMVSERRHAQGVADAAALAGAYSLYKDYYNNVSPPSTTNATAAAVAMAASNGYSGTNNNVVVNCPPASGIFSGKTGYIEVILTNTQSNRFSSIWSKSGISVSARSVARGTVIQSGTAAVILLNPSMSGALSVSGSGRLVTNSSVAVDSNSSTAVNANNAGYVSAKAITIVGGNTTSGGGYLSGTVTNGAAAVADPYASIVEPNATTLGLTTQPSPPGYGSFTIQPGVYNGGVTFGGGSQVTMAPGIYYMKSGSFTVANGVSITGTGVMVYIDNGGGSVSFQGGGNITLSPMTTGTYAGISIFQERTSTAGINIANGSTTNITGAIYAAKAAITFAGGAYINQSASQIVAASMNISNDAYVGVTATSSSGGSTKAIGIVQ